ncbi:MAG: hypothetical protein BroJett003_16090 [Planctomycetota bacterium]|nr:MAG: hypothetical protein BroJett003_16090 [Planctomycetota bacterium]
MPSSGFRVGCGGFAASGGRKQGEIGDGRAMLPVKKVSKAAKRRRRSHHAMSVPNLVDCPKCGKAKLPHVSCGSCGYVSAKVMLSTGDEGT